MVNWCCFCFSLPQHALDSGIETMETDDVEEQFLLKQVCVLLFCYNMLILF